MFINYVGRDWYRKGLCLFKLQGWGAAQKAMKKNEIMNGKGYDNLILNMQ